MGGKASQETGEIFERLVEASCVAYQKSALLSWWSHPGPKVRFYGPKRGSARAVGVAPPDFVFFLGRAFGSRCGLGGMLEVKSTENKDKLALAQRMHQYWQMQKAFVATGHDHFGYLVQWRNAGEIRFYPLREVALYAVEPPKILLVRQRGKPVEMDWAMSGEAPDWLPVMMQLFGP
jgi:hypothetical protein